MHVYLSIFLLSACLCDAYTRFAYEHGGCEVLISTAIREMFENEMRLLLGLERQKIVHFELYTRLNPTTPQYLRTGDTEMLRTSNFNPKWPVRFSIHGWTGKGTSCSNAAIKDAYLSVGNFNVIIVDWSAYTMDLSYARLSRYMPNVASDLVQFVRYLNHEMGIRYESVYLVGHSAGSHIAGLAGKMLAPQRFGVIYALDPAGLTQLTLGPEHRLAPNDAIYTESIHTDITLLGNPSTELTHATFFVNWGLGQPHCPNATAAEFDFACDHFAAIYYFVEAVRYPKAFGALQCRQDDGGCRCRSVGRNTMYHGGGKCGSQEEPVKCACPNNAPECAASVFMGGEPATPKNGIFYLSTRYDGPFGMGGMVYMRHAEAAKFTTSSYIKENFLVNLFDSLKNP